MTDSTNPGGAPGYESAVNSFSAASKTLQNFADEVQRMGKETFEKNTELMEKLRSAKTMEDVFSIQSNVMQQSFFMSAEYTRRFGELMMKLPMEMARNARDAMQQGTDAMKQAGEQAGQEMQKAGEQFAQHRD